MSGEHWINERYLRTSELHLARPAYLMFYPIGSDSSQTLVGVAYGIAQLSGASPPEGFTGEHEAWHIHHPCSQIPGMSSSLTDGAEDCRALGGQPGRTQIAMVHAWLDPVNPTGPFGADNPALPFVAVGLTPPTPTDLSDRHTSQRLRKLAMALGETFGTVPRLGTFIQPTPTSEFATRVAPHRKRIRALLPELRDAEARQDREQFERLTNSAIAEWEIIRQAYLEAANSQALRTLIARWFERSITGMHHGRE